MKSDWLGTLMSDIKGFSLINWLVKLRIFQFLLILPTLAVFAVVLISTLAGIQHPSFNFGLVFTWIVWWGALLLSFVFIGRGWCLVCPPGAIGEWLQRLSLWWKSNYTAGYNFRWPRRLRSMWLATVLFLVFIWLDNGYGISNSPRMTAGLILTVTLGAACVNLFFERRAFCRYVCPLTSFIGVSSLCSMFELRAKDLKTCRKCLTKDCFRGNEKNYGCPMSEFPGGAMDTNVYCILCTECVKSCPYDNISMRFRAPGLDLWAKRRPHFDEAFTAVTLVGLATLIPLLMFILLRDLRSTFSSLLPAGIPPNDPPRLVAVAVLYVVGLGASLGLVYSYSYLSKLAAGNKAVRTRDLFINYAYALVPISLFKFLADLSDHTNRTWGALVDITRALILDFPLNRVIPGRVTVIHLLSPIEMYLFQVGLLLTGLLMALHIMHRVSLCLFIRREEAFRSLMPMAGLGLTLTIASLWTLGMSIL